MTVATLPPPMLQHEQEFTQLLNLYRERQPTRVLEVGTHLGGTLYHWLRDAPADATVVAIDIDPNVRHVVDRLSLELDRPLAVYIVGDSTDPGVIEHVATLGPYDWVFIDGDHHEHAVRSDWLNYGQILAAPGAIVALHDIRPLGDSTIQVDRLWQEIKLEHVTREIDHGGHGIGVVYMPSEK